MGNIVQNRNQDPNKYFLVFTNHQTEGPGWRTKFLKWIFDRLKPGFSHVFVIVERPGWPFLCVECCSNNLFCEEILKPDLLSLLKASGATILQVPKKEGQIGPRGLISCVSIAKHFLGINNWAVTPYQLYQSILKEKPHGWKKI